MGYLWVPAKAIVTQGKEFVSTVEQAASAMGSQPLVAIDLIELEYVNSEMLSFLIRLKKRIEEKSGAICIVNVSDYCEDLLDKLRLNTVFTIYKSTKHFEEFQKTMQNQDAKDCLQLTGNITAASADALRSQIKTRIDAGIKNITLDMSHVNIIDSIGVGVLIQFAKVLGNDRGALKLINVTNDIFDFLHLLSLDKRIEIRRIEG
jgi:anti-anti-sigma factor